jgi:hypothetical protein
MRECLGWLTNCTDDRRCPQNWLELSYSELPTTVRCHVCEREVRLTTTEGDFENAVADQVLAAFPVVPCVGAPASYNLGGTPAGDSSAHALPSSASSAGIARSSQPPPAAPPAKAATSGARIMYCVLGSGESVRLDKEIAVIGRSRTCDIVIPSAKVSRQHANVLRVGDDYFVEDLGSANGVWRDGEKMSGKVKINNGDVLTISEETLTFEMR